MKNRPVILTVLDGFGMNMSTKGNAIYQAKKPNFDILMKKFPSTVLQASGEAVGLPQGLAGNSEVGHLNLGAGRIVKQELTKINEAIESKSFFRNPVLLSAIQHAKANGTQLHIMGLLSDGQVHSDYAHIFALLEMIKQHEYEKEVFVHAFTDGRDVKPRSAVEYIEKFQEKADEIGLGKIASIIGRATAMDRAHNWERIKKTYELLTEGKGVHVTNPTEGIQSCYINSECNDQHIEPTVVVDEDGKPLATIKDRDVVIFINLRSDRARQLSKPFIQHDFDLFERNVQLKDIFFVGLTNFGDDLPMSIAFPEFPVTKTLPEIFSQHGMKQLYVAEEEKYAHVTYFFHGGSTTTFKGEKKIIIDSKSVENYIDLPEMSLDSVVQKLVEGIESEEYDFIMVNIANPDMLGHTGNLESTIKAVEYADEAVGKIYEAVKKMNAVLVLTSDHGNADEMLDPGTGEMITKHSAHPVPFILADHTEDMILEEGNLGDVAPTILHLMGIQKPKEMTGESLINE